ncbi:MAG: response regulator transcription factor [Actinomycetota bacterium]|jgi:two-component system OmpR family response regulator|nr:response regulator transcription factor [Actinomycetota bacterium]
MRVLVVEDEIKMAALLQRSLTEDGYTVDVIGEGKGALAIAKTEPYAAIVLDIMMPGMDGFEVCRELRANGCWIPILIVTARTDVSDRVEGLDSGADDYLVKPFSLIELSARIRALIRRGQPERPTVLVVGDLKLDPARHRVWRADKELTKHVSPKEFALLELFMRNPGRVLSREQIIDQIWGLEDDWFSNVVDQYVAYLRRKVDRPFDRDDIETIRGVGYRLKDHSG